MPNKWLTFLSFSVIIIIVFVLFALYLRPVRLNRQAAPAIVPEALSQPTVTFVNPSRGPADAPVTIVVFSEFFCTACRQLAESLDVVERTYPDQVRIVWKNLPNTSLHPLAEKAAAAAHCAAQQGQFWPYHDLLFARQSYLAEDQFLLIAQEIGLNIDSFAACYDSQDALPIVKKDLEEAQALGLTATPSFFLNQERFTGAVDTQALIQYVSQVAP